MAEPTYDFRNWGKGRPDAPAPQTGGQPTREQFDAAAHKVMQTAPAGLSRDQFFALVDKELAGGSTGSTSPGGTTLMLEANRTAGQPMQDAPRKGPPGSDEELNADWWGGFKKSIAKDLNIPALLEMATIRPSPTGSRVENASEVLPFLVPTALGEGGGAVNNLKAQFREIGANADALRKGGAGRFKAYGQSIMDRLNDSQTTGMRRLQREPFRWTELDNDMPSGEGTPRSAPSPAGPTENMSDLPLWKQQELMESGGSVMGDAGTTRTQSPPYQPKPPKPTQVRPAQGGGTPVNPSLDETLLDALNGAAKPEDARITSLPPEVDITGGGPLKQSGKFKKSESVGQAGGYSSGKPGITPEGYDELDAAASGARERTAGGVMVDPDAAVTKYIGKEPPPTGGTPPLEEQLTELDPGGMAQNAQDLRTLRGSRDAARDMFGTATPETQGWIKQMAPGPSRMPLEALDRIRRAGFSDDDMLGLLMAGLGGHTTQSLWNDQ